MHRLGLLVVVACGSSTHPQSPPPKQAETCDATADHVYALIEPKDDHAKRLRDAVALRCSHDAWPADVRTCLVGTTSLKDPKHCKQGLTLDQREALDRDLAEAERAAKRGKLGPQCERYKDLITTLIACEKLDASTKTALKQGFDAMAEGWTNIDAMPAETREAMEDGCRIGGDALVQASSALCPP